MSFNRSINVNVIINFLYKTVVAIKQSLFAPGGLPFPQSAAGRKSETEKENIMLTVGDRLPAFNVPVQQGTGALPAGERLTDRDFAGKWKILFFWPKDFTFVCPTEIVGYADLKQDFEDRDAVLIGGSTDTDFVHFAWRRSDDRLAKADFPWIADNKKELSTALGILHEAEGVPLRATFIVDPENIIQHVTVNGLNVGRNPQETLRVLDALQTDELCPCNWQAGEDVLKVAA
jgi:peroxiredoxin (alkyl hydroperoxide reductase subunit C)